jgi:hypothetical protein
VVGTRLKNNDFELFSLTVGATFQATQKYIQKERKREREKERKREREKQRNRETERQKNRKKLFHNDRFLDQSIKVVERANLNNVQLSKYTIQRQIY